MSERGSEKVGVYKGVSMSTCVRAYLRECVGVGGCVCVCIRACVRVCVCMCICVCVCVYVCAFALVCVCGGCVYLALATQTQASIIQHVEAGARALRCSSSNS
jgi:hypothetical protein